MLDLEAVRQLEAAGTPAGNKINVKNAAAFIAVEVAMFLHVGAVAGGGTVKVDVPDHTAFHEGIEAIVNCGHRDIRHTGLGSDKDFFDGGMIALFDEHIVHMLPLGRETKAAGGQPLIEAVISYGMLI